MKKQTLAAIWLSVCSAFVMAADYSIAQQASALPEAGKRLDDKARDSRAIAAQFLQALLKKDVLALKRYEADGDSYFFDGDNLEPTIDEFLYASNPATGKRSVKEIANSGELSIKIVHQKKNGVFTAIYVPKIFEGRLNDNKFLENEWMKNYFACEFALNNGKYVLNLNFCFAETDGPYASDPYDSDQ